MARARHVTKNARKITSAGWASSEGCTPTGPPRRGHRWLTGSPKQTATSRKRATLLALSTPENPIASTVEKRIQSVLSLCAISIFRLQLVDNLFEELATLLVALELVEAGAGGRQQHRVAGHGMRVGMGDGRFDGPGGNQRDSALKLLGDLRRGSSDEQGGVRLGGQRSAQRSVFQALVLAAKNHPEAAGEGVQGFERGIHAGGFGIVIELHPADRTYEFQAVLDGPKRADGGSDPSMRDAGAGGRNRRGEHIFDIVAAADGDVAGRHERLAVEHQRVTA